ncbi:MAG: hypothetical protein MI922_17815, partial [Bacteroidales bacterium]|nr:hypothetical protein [Bacteroidales bacterium]
IDFSNENILNSIDLVNYLLNHSANYEMNRSDMLKFVHQSVENSNANIYLFIKMLSNNAVGALKESLEECLKNADQFHSYEAVVQYLCSTAGDQSHSREELYKLMLDMAGVVKIETLLEYLEKKGFTHMLAALENVDMSQFSNSYEVMQFILANSSSFAYNEWNICEMLSIMLLEKGSKKAKSGKFDLIKVEVEENTYTNLFLFIGIGIVLAILLFIMRKNKKSKEI